jgi:Asp-tRNA(Asn)/Glu-tRNA(Gln) amidotransferase C subunit
MSLTQEQIEKISEKLSKIKLNDPKFVDDINSIVGYIDLLDEVDTT